VPHPKDFMGFLADVQEGDDPDDWPTYEDPSLLLQKMSVKEEATHIAAMIENLKNYEATVTYKADSKIFHASDFVQELVRIWETTPEDVGMIEKVVEKVVELFPETATFFAVESQLINNPPTGMEVKHIRSVLKCLFILAGCCQRTMNVGKGCLLKNNPTQ
jgi:hypothetical protein